MVIINCIQCDTNINDNSFKPFCSEKCLIDALNTKKKNPNYSGGKFVKCDWCGSYHYRLPKRMKENNYFCSKPCMDSYKKYYSYLNLIDMNDIKTSEYIQFNQDCKNIIYKITNIINNKVYIGVTTKGLHDRIQSYLSEIKTHKDTRYIIRSMRKYGINNFKFQVLEYYSTISNLEIGEREKYWIDYYQSNNNQYGYNLATGGKINTGYKKTQKQIENNKLALKDRDFRGNKNPFYGMTHNKETINKIIESNKNRKGSKSKPMSEDTKKKISDAKKGLYIGEKKSRKLRKENLIG